MKVLLLLLVSSLVLTEVLCGRKAKKVKSNVPVMPDEARLYLSLTRNYDNWNPERAVIPVMNTSETMHVNFGLALIRFNFDASTNIASLQTWERYMWKDHFLSWSPEDFGGIDQIRIPIAQIWKPDIVLYNAAEQSVELEDALAVVTSDGTVLYIPRVNHKVRCSLDSTNLYCRLKFGSWTFDGFRLNMDFYDGLEKVDLSDYVWSNDYEKVENAAKKNVKYYPCCMEPYPDLTFSLQFEDISGWFNGKK